MEIEKKKGRPLGKMFEFSKNIRLNEEQNGNWNTDEVRAFLNSRNQLTIIREMFENGVIKVYTNKMTEEYKNTLEEL